MACRLFDAKPLPEPMLPCCQLYSWEQISVKFKLEFYHFHSRTFIWKCLSSAKMVVILSRGDELNDHVLGPYMPRSEKVYSSDFELTKDTACLAAMGELWDVFFLVLQWKNDCEVLSMYFSILYIFAQFHQPSTWTRSRRRSTWRSAEALPSRSRSQPSPCPRVSGSSRTVAFPTPNASRMRLSSVWPRLSSLRPRGPTQDLTRSSWRTTSARSMSPLMWLYKVSQHLMMETKWSASIYHK